MFNGLTYDGDVKKSLTDQQWRQTFPVFGFMVGRAITAASARHRAMFDDDEEVMRTFYRLAELCAAGHHAPANMQRLLSGELSPDEFSKIKLVPVSALSLSAIMRKPRESTRRRLKKLVDLDMVRVSGEHPNSGYVISEKSIAYFFQDDRILYEDLASMVSVIERLQQSWFGQTTPTTEP